MILINVKFKPLAEYTENFRDVVEEFTQASRSEAGCLWFEWYRSTDDPTEYFLCEAFQDDAAEAHVNSDHFRKASELFPTVLRETPEIINTTIEGRSEWDRMGEFQVENGAE
ncbi:putative quinol monooxygenase [Corynebacterium heidelbergense]|uniref:Antibiotic biosynthesis monooxygenase n=1 Tax=Corynebacterium heidelbergense TaxID=2055947 RepID=A0A364VAL2_9CORY|nr:putative quinol monooxygenase [Corynebacterium heidelbergense]RAV31639.1 antibiotic biosynthesis monooxygenase [Corynebacterium heidelbergense]RAV33689.1 antibiotic biosynthesis monooxygenase [Corynebacterium heidelbergense]WCZ37108.1 Antibiotic biosynthesis monooxygenase [Corynebacterium heidelbergense]